jgi:hypothetical protein
MKSRADRSGEFIPTFLNPSLAETYGLTSAEMPSLALTNNLLFVAGFSYAIVRWYPLIERVSSSESDPTEELTADILVEINTRGRLSTAAELRERLKTDPSGATWLEQMARMEFSDSAMELFGALKAISGARKMHEQLWVAAPTNP